MAANLVPWCGATLEDLTSPCFLAKGIKTTILSDSSWLFSINLGIFLRLSVYHSFINRAHGFLLGPMSKIGATFAWFLQLPSQTCESITSESQNSCSSEGAASQFAARFE